MGGVCSALGRLRGHPAKPCSWTSICTRMTKDGVLSVREGGSARCSGCVLQGASPRAAGVGVGQRQGCVCLRVGPPTGLHKGAGLQPLPHPPRLTDSGPCPGCGNGSWPPGMGLCPDGIFRGTVAEAQPTALARTDREGPQKVPSQGPLLSSPGCLGVPPVYPEPVWDRQRADPQVMGSKITFPAPWRREPHCVHFMHEQAESPPWPHARSRGGRALSAAWLLALYCCGFPAWPQRGALPDGPPNVAPFIPRVSTAFPYMASGLSKCFVLGQPGSRTESTGQRAPWVLPGTGPRAHSLRGVRPENRSSLAGCAGGNGAGRWSPVSGVCCPLVSCELTVGKAWLLGLCSSGERLEVSP